MTIPSPPSAPSPRNRRNQPALCPVEVAANDVESALNAVLGAIPIDKSIIVTRRHRKTSNDRAIPLLSHVVFGVFTKLQDDNFAPWSQQKHPLPVFVPLGRQEHEGVIVGIVRVVEPPCHYHIETAIPIEVTDQPKRQSRAPEFIPFGVRSKS